MKYVYMFEFNVTDGDELHSQTKKFRLEKEKPILNEATIDYVRDCILIENADYSIRHKCDATLKSISMTSIAV